MLPADDVEGQTNPQPPTPNRQDAGLSYRYPVDRLWSGGSYGNPDCFARTDALSNLDGFWHAGSNDWLCGRFDLRIEEDLGEAAAFVGRAALAAVGGAPA